MCSVSEMSVSEGTDRIIATTSTLPQEKCAHLFPKVDMFEQHHSIVDAGGTLHGKQGLVGSTSKVTLLAKSVVFIMASFIDREGCNHIS